MSINDLESGGAYQIQYVAEKMCAAVCVCVFSFSYTSISYVEISVLGVLLCTDHVSKQHILPTKYYQMVKQHSDKAHTRTLTHT